MYFSPFQFSDSHALLHSILPHAPTRTHMNRQNIGRCLMHICSTIQSTNQYHPSDRKFPQWQIQVAWGTIGKIYNNTTDCPNPATVNKWQSGKLSTIDKCFYAVPAKMDCILWVNTNTSKPASTYSIDILGVVSDCEDISQKDVHDKWQSGSIGRDGRIYVIPKNINHVMVIAPGDITTVEMLK